MDIKEYWKKNPPQTWYSKKRLLSTPWFNEIAYKRYNIYYPYLPDVAEFDSHRGEDILEIGTGIGTDLVQYAKGGARVTGVELNKQSLDITRVNLLAYGLSPMELTVASADDLPYADDSFDLVFCFGVLHHMHNTQQAIDEIYRVLKPEGKAIIMLYAPGWKHILKRILFRGVLMLELLRYGYQGMLNKNTEVNGNSPLTKVYWRPRKLFKRFGKVEITRHRMGEYFDYAPYNTRKFPRFITRFMYLFVGLLGENWIIKATRTDKQKGISVWKTLLKP